MSRDQESLSRSRARKIFQKNSVVRRNSPTLHRSSALPSLTMPDGFFVSKKVRKRKRSSKSKDPSSSKTQVNGKGRPDGKKKRRDEELDSDATQDDVDDLGLRASESDANASGDEDELETPAEKRLRLAKVYLDSLKEGLGMFYDRSRC